MDNLFEDYMSARCTIKALKRTIEEFRSGERYMKLQKDYHRVAAGYIKEIKRLKLEVGRLNAHAVSIRNMWADDYYAMYEEMQAEIRRLKETIRRLEDKVWEEERKSGEKITKLTLEYEDKLHEKDLIINELTNRLAHDEALLGRDSTNTSLPTSKTPAGKKKRIPNSRAKSCRPKGGQTGHEKHELERPDDAEVTDVIEYTDGGEDFLCPACGSGSFVPTGECEVKYEYDVEVVVKKIKHVFYYYQCLDCGTVFRSVYPANLRGSVQYGSGIQALALTLTNNVNAAMNKASMFLAGISQGELTPCEGYVAKLQKRAAKGLQQFCGDLKMLLITRRIVYWDDTVITVMTKRACFRFYGDVTIAYYTAHAGKGWEGINEDGVLELLTPDTWVMHDHNTINYNGKFSFKNIECNQHGERDCQKNSDDTGHKWSSDVKNLMGKTIKDRDKAALEGCSSFSASYIKAFNDQLDEYLSDGWKENAKDPKNYGADFERALLRRIEKYRENYFAWMKDFSLPTTNNLSLCELFSYANFLALSLYFCLVWLESSHNNYLRPQSFASSSSCPSHMGFCSSACILSAFIDFRICSTDGKA